MLDRLRALWSWFVDDLDNEDADRELAALDLDPPQRYVVAVVRAAFGITGAFIFYVAVITVPMSMYLSSELLGWDLPWFLLGLGPPLLVWFVLRKPRVLLRAAALRALARRARRRAAVDLDAVSASSSPVAVVVDVTPSSTD